MITEDDVNPATLVTDMLRPPWRHDLYQALEGPGDTAALVNAVARAAAAADASAAQLRGIVEAVVAEGYEELGCGFTGNAGMPEDYLLELCDRGVLIDELGHRPGPRSLLTRMCEVHRYEESILTLGLELYRDPRVPPDEFAAFVRRYGDVSDGRLLRALAEADPDSALKQTAYEDMLGASPTATDGGRKAAGFHARHLANAPGSDIDGLARFLDRYGDPQVLVLLLESRIRDPERGELVESRARDATDPMVSDALRRRKHRRDAAGPSLGSAAAAALAATGDPDVLLLLAANTRTPRSILHDLSGRRASRGARAIRNAATRTLLDLARRTEARPEI
ncbi:hypothetical protein [Streptomyces sp. NPDC049040]|uniref:hypothetical protein n=1 Tax=Streptomyces sp. NPDC049040 TaxID=3365593 RepID=UPI003711320E